jgi:hypothetical protein
MSSAKSENIAVFCAAVFANAWAYVIYGTGAGILAVWGYVESQKPLPWLWFTIATLSFLMGSYKAWRDERGAFNKTSDELNTLKTTVPRLEGEISTWQTIGPPPDEKRGTLFIYAAIINRGAPTVVDQWEIFIGTNRFHPDADITVDLHGKRGNLVRSKGLLEAGDRWSGWVACRLDHSFYPVDDKYHLPKIELRFCDYLKNQYSASWEETPE